MPFAFGSDHQMEAGGGPGGKFGDLADGTYLVTIRWEIKEWVGGQYGDSRNLRLKITGNGITEDLSTGTAPQELTVHNNGRTLECTRQGWQISRQSKGALFVRKLEQAAGGPVSTDWADHDGMTVTIERDEYSGMGKKPHYPRVTKVENFRTGRTADTGPLPATTGAASPPGYSTWAKAAILAMCKDTPKVHLGDLEPDKMATFLPETCVTGDDKLNTVKLLMDPTFLKTQDGWLYDAEKHAVVVI